MPRSKTTKKIVLNLSPFEFKIIEDLSKQEGYQYKSTFLKEKIVKELISVRSKYKT